MMRLVTLKKRTTVIIITIIIMMLMPQYLYASSASYHLKQQQNNLKEISLSTYKTSIKEQKPRKFAVASIQQNKSINMDDVNNRQLLVRVEQGTYINFFSLGLEPQALSDALQDRGYHLLAVPVDMDYQKVIRELNGTNGVLSVEPDYKRQVSYIPSDPNYKKQWYLNRISMPKAWDITKGSSEITIAVLDTGVDADHPDLKGRILPGYDFVDNDDDPSDDHGHGTHVAGVIAANSNQIGVTGIDFNAKILPIKVANQEGKAAVADVVDGIYYAIEQGADIINMSYGTYEFSSSEDDALWEAYNAGIVLVAAAGNDNTSDLSYPAAYTPVISVSAINQVNERTTFSNYGSTTDLTAPGENILSTYLDEKYAYDSGTSFSAPIVSGIASLLLSKYPNWTPEQIEWALESSAERVIDSEWTSEGGYGVVNAYKALSVVLPSMEADLPDFEEEAVVVPFNQTKEEMIELPMDVDWVKFKVEKAGSGTISITNVASHLDLIGVLYHYVNDEQVGYYEIDKHDAGQSESMTMNFKPGTYYLGVYDIFNHWATQPYHLRIAMEGIGSFPDVQAYIKEIEYLTELNIINGYPDGTFKPKNNVTRLQAVQMLLNQMGINVAESPAPDPGFTDIRPGMYGYTAVAKAVELGFISGKEDNTFDPTGNLTRAQMAVILAGAYNLQGNKESNFKDIPVDYWAYNQIDALATHQITKGYPDLTFKPNQSISREHFAIFVYNYLTNL